MLKLRFKVECTEYHNETKDEGPEGFCFAFVPCLLPSPYGRRTNHTEWCGHRREVGKIMTHTQAKGMAVAVIDRGKVQLRPRLRYP